MQGQILKQPEGNDFTFPAKFSPAFIGANKIREIRSTIESKKDGDRIRKTDQNLVYQFYPDGNLQMQSHINHRLRDTAITIYQYAGNRLECEIKNDAAGMFSYCYTYGTDAFPASRKYGRAEKSRRVYTASEIGETTHISTETYTHLRYENQLHSTLHNAAGRPYQKEIRYYDENGYLNKYIRSFVLSSDRYEERYTYQTQGWLASKEIVTTKDPHILQFAYDEVGNLLSEERHENEVLIYRKEYLYEGKNMLLKADLRRDDINHLIYITTYTYTFW